jgi:L-ascorbate metabolism protein UlaG (beta-lactamase superfamily)
VKRREDKLTWLGQAGFLLELAGRRLLIDPWLSPHEGRLVPAAPFELVSEGIDCVLVTHEHEDHLDLAFLRRLTEHSPDTQLILPAPVAPMAEGLLVHRPIAPGDRLEVGGVEVRVVPARHCVDVVDGYGEGGGRFVGYVISAGGLSIYHAGDTLASEVLLDALAAQPIDLALLPINGRDAERESRNIAGNLNAQEAVELAVRSGAHTLVPYHWDAIAGNTARPGGAADAAAARAEPLHVLVLAQLRPYRLAGLA